MPASCHQPSTSLQRVIVPEALDARAQEAAGAIPAGAAGRAHGGQADPRPGPPGRIPGARGHEELERRHLAAGADRAGQLAQHRRRVVDVAQQIGVHERVHRRILERQRLGLALHQLDAAVQPGRRHPLAAAGEHRLVLVDPDHAAAVAPGDRHGDGGGAGGDVGHDRVRPDRQPVDQQVVPAPVVAEREQLRPAVVVGRDAVEQTQRVALACRGVLRHTVA